MGKGEQRETEEQMSARTKDVIIRAAKTFVQAFLGVLIPALAIYIQGGWPPSWAAFWSWLAPVVAAALAAAISAGWNAVGLPREEERDAD